MTDKIEQFWRDATADDIARMMKGEDIKARFRDRDTDEWSSVDDALGGYDSTEESKWIDHTGYPWRLCQVYDPQQWYLDKPIPGEGWRLLEKFPDEPKLNTDEFFDTFDNTWTQVGDTGSIQYDCVWYRRRIEPVKQDAGSTCASTIPKGWAKLSNDEPRLASDAFWSVGAKDWVIIGDARLEAADRDKWPAIRQVDTHKSMQLVLWHQYRLPNGRSIKVTKEGFDLL
jgi:hypothetical protein